VKKSGESVIGRKSGAGSPKKLGARGVGSKTRRKH
jgi:hypothetical protein